MGPSRGFIGSGNALSFCQEFEIDRSCVEATEYIVYISGG